METAAYYRQKAAQCLRLSGGVDRNDPLCAALIALAEEFAVRAKALEGLARGATTLPIPEASNGLDST